VNLKLYSCTHNVAR